MQDSKRPSALHEFPVVVTLPIQWGELDAYGHVNNVVFLKWFESARARYGSRVGVDMTPNSSGYGAIVASVSCQYLRPLSYPGDVIVGVRVTRMSIGSVTLGFCIVDARTGVPAAEGNCDAVLYDHSNQRPCPIPDFIREAVEELEGKQFSD